MNEKKCDDCFAVSIGDLGPNKLTLTLALQRAESSRSPSEKGSILFEAGGSHYSDKVLTALGFVGPDFTLSSTP
jgi:hypothetical protein